jgi:Ran GTPase-activating protein (RanGAP) involved in mRNA processing and transport
VLKVNYALKIIDLYGNDFGVEGAKVIADALKVNRQLRQLISIGIISELKEQNQLVRR